MLENVNGVNIGKKLVTDTPTPTNSHQQKHQLPTPTKTPTPTPTKTPTPTPLICCDGFTKTSLVINGRVVDTNSVKLEMPQLTVHCVGIH